VCWAKLRTSPGPETCHPSILPLPALTHYPSGGWRDGRPQWEEKKGSAAKSSENSVSPIFKSVHQNTVYQKKVVRRVLIYDDPTTSVETWCPPQKQQRIGSCEFIATFDPVRHSTPYSSAGVLQKDRWKMCRTERQRATTNGSLCMVS
jgi:hypothetical protein